jgi:acetyltransferase-like isoleucine patch superfamily enzyme
LRNLVHHPVGKKNSLHYWTQAVHPLKVVRNFLIIQFCRYAPSMRLKNPLYRILGMKVGKNVSFGLMAMVDIFFPQMITIGENSILGYNCTLLCHEFLIHEYRTGPIVIGKDVMIGANATILPGVTIGDRAVIGAGAVVVTNVPADTKVFGIPAKPKETTKD